MKWISVKDELPDKECNVIVFDYMDVVSANWDNDFRRFYNGCTYLGHVTHWMPLPKPPELEK